VLVIPTHSVIFAETPEENRPLRRPKCRWEDNIKGIFKNGMGECGLGL
jgi:hypothetical protein